MSFPEIHEIHDGLDVEQALLALADCSGVILFDSALARAPLGRYTFLTADPFQTIEIPRAQYSADPFAEIRTALNSYECTPNDELPPFQGGAAGMAAYSLGHCWEEMPFPRIDEFALPVFSAGLYDWVLAWDHQQERCWLISQGFPESDPARRIERAIQRRLWVLNKLEQPRRLKPSVLPEKQTKIESPTHELPGRPRLMSNFSREGYLRAIEQVIEYIYAGDIYQANLSQRLLFPADRPAVETYLRLRHCNPAPFAGYYARKSWAILSASPERFLQLQNAAVETRPIKGTRLRRRPSEVDLFTKDELQESGKDLAENVMIVDLLRNDLSRVCQPGSIRVPQLCRLESFETVHHLVSVIQGELADGHDAWDLLAASFPGGSITGCPKVRAMEIITELEQVSRGPYCGSLFYVGFDGRMDSNLLIRTMTHHRGWLQLPVGGGITACSDPSAEYDETLHKAAGMIRALDMPLSHG